MRFVFTCASASSHTSRGASEHSAVQSRKLERNPCGTAPIPRSRTSFTIANPESGRPAPRGTPPRSRPRAPAPPAAPPAPPLDKGTRCSRPVFIRSGRNAPLPSRKVHLFPPRAAHLTAPARRQHQELERQHSCAIRPGAAHLLHGPGDLRIRERREMLRADAVLGQRRPDGLSGRVVFPVALGHCPPHHRRDPTPHPLRRLPLLVPDREQDSHQVRRVDPVHRPPAEPRHRVVPQARAPQLLGPARRPPIRPHGPR